MRVFLCGFLACLFLATPGWAQEISAPPASRGAFVLEKIGLDVVIDGQKAACSLKYVLYNPGSAPLEVDFLAPLPEGGALTGVTLLDGKNEMAGQVYGKDEA